MLLLTIRHLFVPNSSNNHRSKILHHKSLLVLILAIIILTTSTFIIRKSTPSVLGVATNISVSDLLTYTNQKRQEAGFLPLVLNETLSMAASLKAADMFGKDYWAHNAPDGTTPWSFVQNVGYNYIYAGENLAKDFNDSAGVVDAWMGSPSHKENLLSSKYEEIGFAVVNGTLHGSETTLVVQMFGKRYVENVATAAVPAVAARREEVEAIPLPTVTVVPPTPTAIPVREVASLEQVSPSASLVAGIRNKPLINSEILSKRVSVVVLASVIIAFILDMLYIERKKLVRLVGHNGDHILFLAGVLGLLLLFGRGVIL